MPDRAVVLTEADRQAAAEATDLIEMNDAELREYFGIGRSKDAKVIAFEQARELIGQLIAIIERLGGAL